MKVKAANQSDRSDLSKDVVVAQEKQEENKKASKGFAGLESLVSDLEIPSASTENNEISHASVITEASTPRAAPLSTESRSIPSGQKTADRTSGVAGSKWILGILSIAVVVLGVGVTSKNPTLPSSTPAPTSSPPVSAPAQSRPSSIERTSKPVSPKFNEFPSVAYAGPRAAVALATPFDRMFRTRIRQTQSEDINFAGEYVLTTWGCGTTCSTGVAVSARTGRVIELPGTICCWKGSGNNIIFRKDSRLLVLAGLINEQGQHGTHFYELRDNQFFHIKTVGFDDTAVDLVNRGIQEARDDSPHNPDPVPTSKKKASSPQESTPPIGQNNLLSIPQIRYCLAEDIRMDAAKAVLNNYSDSDVDRFNEMVADYNSRCGSFRYRSGSLESARRDVEPYRSALQGEGRSRFARSPSPGVLSAPAPTRAAPDETVRVVQQKLNELGYNAGPADGLMGKGTRAAIIAFQRDTGLNPDGLPTSALLQHLLAKRQSGARQTPPAITPLSPSTSAAPPAAIPSQRAPFSQEQTTVSADERSAIERTCDSARQYSGPSAYQACLAREMASLKSAGGRPDMSLATDSERSSIERACDSARQYSGPGAYYNCLNRELSSLSASRGRPDISRSTAFEQAAIERACDSARQYSGPGAYYNCLNREISSLRSSGGAPDFSNLTPAATAAVERACESSRQYSGPGTYYNCLRRELGKAG